MASEVSAVGARHLFTGTSSPCLSVFKPVDLGLELPATAAERVDDSLFWRHERLHRAALQGWAARAALVRLESEALQRAALETRGPAAPIWAEHREAIPAWMARLEAAPRSGPPLFRASWWLRSRVDGLGP
jgi:hypothetical protein